MKRSLSIFPKLFFRSLLPQKVNQAWINLFKATFLVGGYYHYFNCNQIKAECSFFQASKFNFHSAAKSTIVIYRHNQDNPIAAGIILDEKGLCLSIANVFTKVSEERLEMGAFYAKVLGDGDQTYALSFQEYLSDDNLAIFKLVTRDPDVSFHPVKFTNEVTIGTPSYAVGKSGDNFNLVESGIINETSFNAKLAFGKENDTNSFNLMANIPNKYTSLFGGALFNEVGQALCIVIPFEDRLLSSHILATPYSFLEGILKQVKDNGRVRRPYLGMTIKSSASGTGAFIIKINSDGPASQAGVRLGDTIVEINDQKITNNNDFFKCLGYRIGQDFKMKLERDGKYRTVHLVSG